jgi:RES domain
MEEGGPLFFAQPYQGRGRHDNPAVYGCLYVAEREVSAIVESLRVFTATVRLPARLQRRGLPLAVAAIELSDHEQLVDLDEPRVLSSHRLRPSLVATGDRTVTQPQALALYSRHRDAAGLRWWSTFEALWANVTIFDRAASSLQVNAVRELTHDDEAVVAAADLLGLAP